jgi:pimeloyl-ACP methyl ester carboxylesterase
MRKTRIVLAIVSAYFILIFFAHLPDHLILFPTKAPIDTGGAVRKTLPFQNGELELWTAVSHQAKDGAVRTFTFCASTAASRSRRPLGRGRGGRMEWPPSRYGNELSRIWWEHRPARLSRIGPAALTAFDELKRHAAGRPIVLFGASLGATAALHVAAHRPVAGLILHNPPPLRQMILRQFGWWNLWLLAGPIALQIPRDLDGVANAKAIHAPAIFLLAEKDEVVAPRYHRLVVDAYAGEKRVISLRDTYHNTTIEDAGLADLFRALDWLLPKTTR